MVDIEFSMHHIIDNLCCFYIYVLILILFYVLHLNSFPFCTEETELSSCSSFSLYCALSIVFFFRLESRRPLLLQIKASSSEETSTSVDAGELFTDLKEKVRSKAIIVSSYRNKFTPFRFS